MISVYQKNCNSFCSGAVTVVCGTRSQFGITTNNSQFLAGNSLSAIFEGNFETNMSSLDPWTKPQQLSPGSHCCHFPKSPAPRSESLDLPTEVNLPSRCHSEKSRGEKKNTLRLLQEQVQKVHQVDLKCMFFTKTPIFLACLNMFTATLPLLRVWLQVAMKIKLMLLLQSTYCSKGVANFDPSWR